MDPFPHTSARLQGKSETRVTLRFAKALRTAIGCYVRHLPALLVATFLGLLVSAASLGSLLGSCHAGLQWMALDLHYIDRWTFSLDLWLLLRTIPAVLSGRGAR